MMELSDAIDALYASQGDTNDATIVAVTERVTDAALAGEALARGTCELVGIEPVVPLPRVVHKRIKAGMALADAHIAHEDGVLRGAGYAERKPTWRARELAEDAYRRVVAKEANADGN